MGWGCKFLKTVSLAGEIKTLLSIQVEKDNLKNARNWFLLLNFFYCVFHKSVSNFIHVAVINVTNFWEKYY